MDKLYGKIDKKISDDCIEFNKNIESNMRYRNEISSDLLNLEWLDLLENACPYIDNIIRNPKLTLIREENVNKIEKVRKTSVESVKNLAVHSQYIEKIDDLTKDVQPSKLLEVYNELLKTNTGVKIIIVSRNKRKLTKSEQVFVTNVGINEIENLEHLV